MTVGILALQGAVEPHEEKFTQLGVSSHRVKTSSDLKDLSGIILPGGESSTMIHLLKQGHLWEELKEFVLNRPVWGLCAGAILLAKTVHSPSQASLAAIDIEITRNAYGRQNESFVSSLIPTQSWIDSEEFEGVFIRAPKISKTEASVTTLFSHGNQPVMVRQGFVLASTFHPELSANPKLHRYFLSLCKETS
jgi:5'-phosphate synthase pdxT subunit